MPLGPHAEQGYYGPYCLLLDSGHVTRLHKRYKMEFCIKSTTFYIHFLISFNILTSYVSHFIFILFLWLYKLKYSQIYGINNETFKTKINSVNKRFVARL